MKADTHAREPLTIAIDSDIPYIRGRMEPFARVKYLSQDEFSPESVRDADALIIRTRTRCNHNLLDSSRVKFIATATIGTDQIAADDCRELGIEWTNSPGCNAPAVSQYVWNSLLRLGLKPGMTLGIIGCGNVGRIVREWGERLGYTILVNDPPRAEREGESGFTPLDDLLRSSDAVTIHTPYTRTGPHSTHHLMGEREFSLMRPGAVYVNAARGPVNDTAALIKAIDRLNLSTAIDVWEGEPVINRDLLNRADIATFHIAGYSIEGKQRATAMVCDAVGRHFGFSPDLSGLASPYSPPEILTPQRIINSFNPYPLMELLIKNPENFDRIRAEYKFRPELL